jgi:LL-diaminopimelate aminotransferase
LARVRRLEKLVATLSRCGFPCTMPGGTYFLYTRAPKGLAGGGDAGRGSPDPADVGRGSPDPADAGRRSPDPADVGRGSPDPVHFENAEAASQYLITEQSICTVPWDDAGPYLRFSATYEAADENAEDALMAETESRLKNIRPVF